MRTGDIDEENQRDAALRAQFDEVGSLERRWREENAVVCDDAALVSVDVREALSAQGISLGKG